MPGSVKGPGPTRSVPRSTETRRASPSAPEPRATAQSFGAPEPGLRGANARSPAAAPYVTSPRHRERVHAERRRRRVGGRRPGARHRPRPSTDTWLCTSGPAAPPRGADVEEAHDGGVSEAHATSVALGIAAGRGSANALVRVTAVCVSSSHSATPAPRVLHLERVGVPHREPPGGVAGEEGPRPRGERVHALTPRVGERRDAFRLGHAVAVEPELDLRAVAETAAALPLSTCRADQADAAELGAGGVRESRSVRETRPKPNAFAGRRRRDDDDRVEARRAA